MAASPQSYDGDCQDISGYHCADPADSNTSAFVISINTERGRSSVGKLQRSQC